MRNKDQQSDHIYYTLLWQVLWLPVPFTSLSTVCSTAEPKPFCWAKRHDLSFLHRISTCRATYWALVELLYEHTHRCNSTSTHCVTLHIKIRWRLSLLDSGKWFCSWKCGQFSEASKRHNTAVHLLGKIIMNMIWLLFPVSDWQFIMIGPGDLLLVVYVVPVSVLLGLQKSK
jgi:hypothetical protein